MKRSPSSRRALRRKATTRPAGELSGGRLPRASPISGARGRQDPVTPEVRAEVLERDGGCVLARFEPDHTCWGELEVHHRKLRRHGDHTADNLCVLCSRGHAYVHEHPAVSYAHGLLLRGFEFVSPLEP